MDNPEGMLLNKLAETLDGAMCNAIDHAHRAHAGETPYAYILFTLPLFDYATLSFNTEESLGRLSTDVDKREECRWHPCEWEYHSESEEVFAEVNEVFGQLLQVQGYGELDCEKRRQVLMEVLRNLDARGVFGIGKARESVLVNTMWGDEDCVAHVESARELNPTSIYLRYAKYQLPMLRASEREIQRSRSMYKDQSLVSVRRAIAQVEADMGRRENFDKYLSAVPDVAPPENDRNF